MTDRTDPSNTQKACHNPESRPDEAVRLAALRSRKRPLTPAEIEAWVECKELQPPK